MPKPFKFSLHGDFEIMSKRYDIVNSHSHSFPLATRLMIRRYSLSFGFGYFEINWTKPRFLPEWYEATHHYICTMKTTPAFKYVITNQHYLSSGTTSFRISNLCIRSAWKLILKAVYNPASIDSGISITGPTLSKARGKKTSILDNS